MKPLSSRALKGKFHKLFKEADLDQAMEELGQQPPRRVINPLFSLLYDQDETVRWAAIRAMGVVVERLSQEDIESARVIMRRLMWNLNDESGGIGWGSPEAMGEILARHEGLAREYLQVLISYTMENGNYLEHETLQRGVLWGIGRVSEARPQLVRDAAPYLLPYLDASDATVRGLAARVVGLLEVKEACSRLERLTDDESQIQIYLNRKLISCRVKDLAQQALARIRR